MRFWDRSYLYCYVNKIVILLYEVINLDLQIIVMNNKVKYVYMKFINLKLNNYLSILIKIDRILKDKNQMLRLIRRYLIEVI